MSVQPLNPIQASSLVDSRQHVQGLIGKTLRFARRNLFPSHSIQQEPRLSLRVQAGSSTRTHLITSQRTLAVGLGGALHTALTAPSQVLKVEIVRESASLPAKPLGSFQTTNKQLIQLPVSSRVWHVSGNDPYDNALKLGGRKCIPWSESRSQTTLNRGTGSHTFAVVIGINKYQSPHRPQLQGAVNDAHHMTQTLREVFGVPKSNIRLLCDQDATRQRIISEIKSLTTNPKIQPDDAIIIYFAGHGSQARAPPGWYAEDGMVQTICPVDEGLGKGDSEVHGIPDRTIAALVSEISRAKGRNITLIFDCCHAGGISRGDPPKQMYRSAPTTSCLPSHLDEDIVVDVKAQGLSNPLSSYVLLAACRSSEKAREVVSADGKPCGAFSASLFRHLRKCGTATTYSELLRYVECDLKGELQHPICEGENKNRPLFDGKCIRQITNLFTLSPCGNGCYRVDAGSLHGITPGSRFSVHQLDSWSRSTREIGVMEAQIVSIGSSTLHAADGVSFDVPPRCKAAIMCWGPSDDLLHVFPDGLSPVWTQTVPFHNPRYNIVSSVSTSNLVVGSVKGDQLAFERGHRASELSAEPLRPPIKFTPLTLQHTLNHMNDFHFHLFRSNPSVPPSLRDKVKLRLHKIEDDDGLPGSDLFVDRHAVVAPGAKIGLTIINESRMDLFPYIFIFKSNGFSIQKWYYPPAINMQAPLPCNSQGTSSSLRVGFQGCPFGPLNFTLPDEVEGDTVFLKLFVSTRHVDMDSIEQCSAFAPSADCTSPRRISCMRGGGKRRRHKLVDDAWDACRYEVKIRRDVVTDR